MCGLAGMAGNGVTQDDLSMLESLAFVTALRGQDSTGFAQGSIHKRSIHLKVNKAAAPFNYVLNWHRSNKDGNKQLLRNKTDNFFAVHCRAATVGEATKENTHPFEVGNIVGMHNGTLVGDQWTGDDKKTDSELMFEAISESGFENVLSNLLGKSAYSIVAVDKNTRKIVLARNAERPLYVGVNKSRRVIYWASEIGMLNWAATRHGIQFGSCAALSANVIHRFDPGIDIQVGKWPTWELSRLDNYREKKEGKEEKPKGTNIVPFVERRVEPPRERARGRNSIFMTDCVLCGTELTPLAQRAGTPIGNGQFTCKACDDETINKHKDKRSLN